MEIFKSALVYLQITESFYYYDERMSHVQRHIRFSLEWILQRY